MTAQKNYSGFFSDIESQGIEPTLSKKSIKNTDQYSGFFTDAPSTTPSPRVAKKTKASQDFTTFFADLDEQPNAPQDNGFISSGMQNRPNEDIGVNVANNANPSLEKDKESFFDRLGRAFSFQAQTSNAVTPQGAAIVAKKVPPSLLEGATGGLFQAERSEEPGERVIQEGARVTGEMGLIHGANKFLNFLGVNPKTWYGRIGTGATVGAGLSAGKQAAYKGEVDPAEVLQDAALWAGIDFGLELVNAGLQFKKAVEYISEGTGKSREEVLSFLKDRIMSRFRGKPAPNPQVLAAEALDVAKETSRETGQMIAADTASFDKAALGSLESEAKPLSKAISESAAKEPFDRDKASIEVSNKLEESYPQIPFGRIQTSKGTSSNVVAGKNLGDVDHYSISAYIPEEKMSMSSSGKTLDEATQNLIADIEKSTGLKPKIKALPQEKPTAETVAAEPTFTTAKGSTYIVHADGSTTRNKAARAEHPGEVGTQYKSEQTYYLDDVQAKKLSEIKASGPSRRIAKTPDGSIGIQYDKGAHKGKFEKRTMVTPKKSPEMGLIPLELWSDGKFHFGNKITQVGKKAEPTAALAKKIQQPRSPERMPKAPVMGKKQAVARSKILDLFRKAFNDPLIVGKKKMRMKQASGEHHLWARLSRLVNDNNIETAAHEIGHNLHNLLYEGDAKTPKEQIANVSKALHPYLNELKPLAQYEPWGMEGFAEFTRMYVTNPDVALKMAPNFYAKFEADLEAQQPELKNALLEARDYYDQYLQGTPESRIRAQTDYGEDSSKLDNIIDWVKSNLNIDNLKTQFLDDVFPAKRLVAEAFGIPTTEVENLKDPRNLYRSLRVLKGAVGKADVFLTNQTFDAKTLKRKGRGLRQILRKLDGPEEYREFNDYLIARRSIEKAGQGIETGINIGDAVATESTLSPKYKKLATLLDHYNDALLTYARDGGLLSEEQYSTVKKNNLMYAPFQRSREKESKGGVSTGGKLQAGKPIKRMKGSTRNIIAPIESVIKNTYSIIINSEKNLSGQVLAKLADMKGIGPHVHQVPTPMELKGKVFGEQIAERLAKEFLAQGLEDLVEIGPEGKVKLRSDISGAIPEVFLRFGPGTYPAGENIITVFNEGKPSFFEVSPEIYEMWTKGTAPYTADIIVKILRIPARVLRAGAILNPKFQMKNFIRDSWGAALFTKYGKDVKDPGGFLVDTFYTPLAQLCVAAKQAGLYTEWLKSGGGMSTMQSLDRDSVVKKLKEVRDGISPLQVIKWLRKVSEISEEGNRLAEFGRALSVEGETRLGKEIAAFASRDLSIDFAKMGLQTKVLNQLIPFFNATIQGGDKFFRTIGSDQGKAEFLARSVGFILVPSLILAWLNQDEERISEFHEQEKDFNFITFIGDTAIKIPVPFETGVIVHGLGQRMFNYFMKKDPKAFEGFMGSVVDAMLPNFIPAFANPLIEAYANKSFFTGATIVPMAKKDLIAKYQYKNNTTVTARLIGRAMAYMLGQDTRSKAASPVIIDHFINSWGAGLGRTTVSILDTALQAAGLGDQVPAPDRTIAERFGFDAFVARFPRASSRSIEKFYDYYGDATARQKSIKHAQKIELEEPEELQKAYERVDSLYDYPTLKRGYKAMQMNQRAINAIYLSPDLDPISKRQMLDDLYLQQIQFAKAAVDDIEKHRLAKKSGS